MKIQNFGGAMVAIEHNGKRMLFDPWLDDGIFHGSWYHYPPLNIGFEELGRFDYVYISHIHEDHCSLKTIQKINRDAKIIIIDRNPNYVLNFLKSNHLDFEVVVVAEKTPFSIEKNLVVDMLRADPSHELNYLIDSMLVLRWDDFVIFNANDCPLHESACQYLTERYPRIDLALLPYAGGSGYPSCYKNLSSEQKFSEAARIRSDGLDAFYKSVERLRPRYAMPFADQYVIAGSRSKLNAYMAHPPSPGAVMDHPEYAKYRDRVLLLDSGASFDFGNSTSPLPRLSVVHSDADRESYIEKISKGVVYDHEKIIFGNSVALNRFVELARSKLWLEQERRDYFIDFRFYLDTGEANIYEIDFQNKDVKKIDRQVKKTPYLVLGGSRDLMIMLLIGHISWNIADAALFIDYERNPNQYNTVVHALVNFLRV